VADHLIVLCGGQVRLAGGVHEIIATHRHVTGPAAAESATRAGGQVIAAQRLARGARPLVRASGDAVAHPGWPAEPAGLGEVRPAWLGGRGGGAAGRGGSEVA